MKLLLTECLAFKLIFVVQSLSCVWLVTIPWTAGPGFPILHHLPEFAQDEAHFPFIESIAVSHSTSYKTSVLTTLQQSRDSLRHPSQVYRNINFSKATGWKTRAPHIVLRWELIPCLYHLWPSYSSFPSFLSFHFFFSTALQFHYCKHIALKVCHSFLSSFNISNFSKFNTKEWFSSSLLSDYPDLPASLIVIWKCHTLKLCQIKACLEAIKWLEAKNIWRTICRVIMPCVNNRVDCIVNMLNCPVLCFFS